MKTLLYIFMLFFCLGAQTQATFSITGQVTDEKGGTIPGATVFISNSTYITSTSNNGKFSLGNLQPGNYEVVATFIGFDAGIQTVTIVDKSVNVPAKLIQGNTVLNTITINGNTDPNRKKHMAMFIKNFIGETANGSQSTIVNPEVINLSYDKDNDILSASNDDFILIENKALGYTIRYLIKKFEFNISRNSCVNSGAPHFEAMKGTDAQQKNGKGTGKRLT